MKHIWNAAMLAATITLNACMGTTLIAPGADREDVRANLREQWQGFFDKEDRLWDVAWNVMLANVDLCPNTERRTGMEWLDHDIWRETMRERVYRHPPPKGFSTVQRVATGSPAETAGFLPGDIYSVLDHDGGDWALEVIRDGVMPDTMEVTAVPVCTVWLGVTKDASVNAWTDGEYIGVTEGMIDYVENDDELAFIVAHELAHVAMDHIGKRKSNATLAGLGGALIDGLLGCRFCNTGGKLAASGAAAFSVEFETEADYLGAYMAARAGYDPALAGDFFARMVAASSTPTVWGTTHPVNAARELSAALYAEEISVKQIAGEDLQPNKKEK